MHRDVKADNIMIAPDGQVTVLDFGLAKMAEATQVTEMATILGTPSYMAPEQARGEPVDSRADIWALGVCLYEMVAGEKPFPGDRGAAIVYAILNEEPTPLSRIIPVVPLGLERIVEKALAKNPDERYQDMAEMLAAMNLLRRELSGGFSRAGTPALQPSIAVLPFTNMSTDADDRADPATARPRARRHPRDHLRRQRARRSGHGG